MDMSMRYLAGVVLLFDFLLIPVIALLAIWGRYPKWFITPDDTISPFGLYEPAMRRAYYGTEAPPYAGIGWRHQFGGTSVELFWPKPTGWRRWWGDFVWLGLRNRMLGAAYAFKPADLCPENGTYEHLECSVQERGRLTIYRAGRWKMIKIHLCDLFGHPFGIMAGLKVDSICTDRSTPRKACNLEGRPILSIRRLD